MKFETKALIFILILLLVGLIHSSYFSREDTPSGVFAIGYNIYKSFNPETSNMVDKEFSIREDQYWYKNIYFPNNLSEINIDFEVEDGPILDVYLLEKGEFENFKEDNSFKYKNQLSSTGTKIFKEKLNNPQVMHDLSDRSYYLVIDNSDLGNTTPPMNLKDDVAKVKIKINSVYEPEMK
jgi:hypothetical protein